MPATCWPCIRVNEEPTLMGDPIATFGFELLEGSHLQVHVNWGHEAMGRQIRNQKSEIVAQRT